MCVPSVITGPPCNQWKKSILAFTVNRWISKFIGDRSWNLSKSQRAVPSPPLLWRETVNTFDKNKACFATNEWNVKSTQREEEIQTQAHPTSQKNKNTKKPVDVKPQINATMMRVDDFNALFYQ